MESELAKAQEELKRERDDKNKQREDIMNVMQDYEK
jgi:hypothetical protein